MCSGEHEQSCRGRLADQLLPVLGGELLVAVSEKATLTAKQRELLLSEIKNFRAQGYPIPNGFLVLKGSEVVLKERSSVDKWPAPRIMRQKFLDDGVLAPRDDRLEFLNDVEFSNPSAAAAVIHGGSVNGLAAWKNVDGRTLKEKESS